MTGTSHEAVRTTGEHYLRYLGVCLAAIGEQTDRTDALVSSLRIAKNIHVFGFGRSGTAALAFAIRLRHFSTCLPPVWWAGDQVREPVRSDDLVVLFSQSGSRPEVLLIAGKAKEAGASIVLITADGQSAMASDATLTILLPRLDEPFVYGGGDFELAAWFFQEVLVSAIGSQIGIPASDVERNHV